MRDSIEVLLSSYQNYIQQLLYICFFLLYSPWCYINNTPAVKTNKFWPPFSSNFTRWKILASLLPLSLSLSQNHLSTLLQWLYRFTCKQYKHFWSENKTKIVWTSYRSMVAKVSEEIGKSVHVRIFLTLSYVLIAILRSYPPLHRLLFLTFCVCVGWEGGSQFHSSSIQAWV